MLHGVLFSLGGFLCGSILFSYYLPLLFKGVDVRKMSRDGNPGTANAFLYGGIPVGILCLVLEVGKGFWPVFLALRLLPVDSIWMLPVLLAPAVGHAFSPLQRGQGGKAIAVSFGVLLGLLPFTFIVFLLAFIFVFFTLEKVKPNEINTVYTYSLLMVLQLVFCLPPFMELGIVLLCGIVLYKNMGDAKKFSPGYARFPLADAAYHLAG